MTKQRRCAGPAGEPCGDPLLSNTHLSGLAAELALDEFVIFFLICCAYIIFFPRFCVIIFISVTFCSNQEFYLISY